MTQTTVPGTRSILQSTTSSYEIMVGGPSFPVYKGDIVTVTRNDNGTLTVEIVRAEDVKPETEPKQCCGTCRNRGEHKQDDRSSIMACLWMPYDIEYPYWLETFYFEVKATDGERCDVWQERNTWKG